MSVCSEAFVSNDYKEFFFPFRDENAEDGTGSGFAGQGADCRIRLNDRQSIEYYYLPDRDIFELQPEYIQIPKCYGLVDSENLDFLGVTRLRRRSGFSVYGKDIILGFVDTGIDYRNDIFTGKDGVTRIISVWDQTVQGNVPEGFPGGSEFTREQLIQSQSTDTELLTTDDIGHGSFLAAIAAGKIDEIKGFSGVAPEADIAVVKLKQCKNYLRDYFLIPEGVPCYSETDIMLGIKYLNEVAIKAGKPLVICLGLGTNAGNHKGEIALSAYINSFSGTPNICTVSAAGNEGLSRHHNNGNISTVAEVQVGAEEKGFTLEIWCSILYKISVEIESPSGQKFIIPPLLNFHYRYTFPLDRTVLSIDSGRLIQGFSDQLVFLRFARPAKGIWRIRVQNETGIQQDINMYLPMRNFVSEETFFLSPDPFQTICEPGNAIGLITIGGYTVSAGTPYIETSRGYSALGTIKPDVLAPSDYSGTNFFTAGAGGNASISLTGTSVSSAYAAGCAALIYEVAAMNGNKPDVDDIRRSFIIGARRGESIGIGELAGYPNRIEGYGLLDVYNIYVEVG